MVCPNCSAHIGRFELDQNCKKCGVNLFYFQQEKLLSDDAKLCELEYASFRILVSKIKTAYIKGALPIMRMVFTVLCICVLLIPFAGMNTALPLFNHSISFGGIGLYQSFADGSLLNLLKLKDMPVTAELAAKALVLIGSMVPIILCAGLLLLILLLAFINVQKSAKIMLGISAAGTVFSLISAICAILFQGSASAFTTGIITAHTGAGAFVSAAAFAAMAVINILIIKKKITPAFNEVDLERIKLHKSVKRGEVLLSQLSLPVFGEDGKQGAPVAQHAGAEGGAGE